MSHRRMVVVAGVTLSLGVGVARAQLVVTDPAVTLRAQAVAALKSQVLNTLGQEAERVQRMATRLSASTSMDRYVLTDVPMWRIPSFRVSNFMRPMRALNYGDDRRCTKTSRDRGLPARTHRAGRLAPARGAVPELATFDAAEAPLSPGRIGQLRFNGRRELAAIDALENDVLDPSQSQSATAVLDKISGAGLIRARQQQARIQFLGALDEQLLVDNKRSRDTETATMNMQLERLRWGRAANSSLVAGAADALRTWRQP